MKFDSPIFGNNYIVANFDDIKIFEATTKCECENFIVESGDDVFIFFFDGEDWVKCPL